MEYRQVRHITAGRTAGNALLALFIGALLPFIALIQISLLVPVLMLGGICAARIQARSGWIPACVLIAASMITASWLMGLEIALILLAAALMPALPIARAIAQKTPFFRQLRLGVIAYVAGLLVALTIAYASFGSGMIAQFINVLRAEYDRMPDATLQPIVEWANSLLTLNADRGVPLMTVDSFRVQLTGVLDLMQQTYAQILPGALLSGAVLSGVLSVLWGNWTMARQGMATNDSFVGMSGWFLPAQFSFGALALWLLGLILMYSGYASGATVYMTISQVIGAAFAVQALCAFDRRMLRGGSSLGHRRILIGLICVVALLFRGAGSLLCYIGVASALFGSHGAVKLWLQKRQDDRSDQDDPDE